MLMTENEIKALPILEGFKTVRIKFRKAGRLQYISHLDLQRSAERIIARAGLPVWYTQGFNPHMKLNFAVPLPVGVESECELLDLRLCRDMPCEVVRDLLNAKLTDELRVTDVWDSETNFRDIAYAEYSIWIDTFGADKKTLESIAAALEVKPIMMIKHSKSGDKDTDISGMFSLKRLALENGVITLEASLASGEGNTLNPQMLIAYLKEACGILSTDPTSESCRIVRKKFTKNDGSEFR